MLVLLQLKMFHRIKKEQIQKYAKSSFTKKVIICANGKGLNSVGTLLTSFVIVQPSLKIQFGKNYLINSYGPLKILYTVIGQPCSKINSVRSDPSKYWIVCGQPHLNIGLYKLHKKPVFYLRTLSLFCSPKWPTIILLRAILCVYAWKADRV